MATAADPTIFRSGRDFAAWIGLVPPRISTGGKQKLGPISKQGDHYLRRILIVGAIAVLRRAQENPGKYPWLTQLLARRPFKVVAVALANKMARTADIYVRSEKAGRRVMESLTRFIERRLKLQINAEKSAVARPWHRSFLGFTVRNEPEFRRCIADKAIIRFKHRVRELTRRHRGITLERMIRELASYLRGWAGYFGISQWRELQSLDGWVRRRLRCVVWVQWKTRGRRYRELRRLNVPERAACEAIFSPKGPWRLSSTYAMHRAFTNAHFKRLGLPPSRPQ